MTKNLPAETNGRQSLTTEQRRLIRDVYARGSTDEEFSALFLVAEARGLDPRMGHCHFVKRWNSQSKREEWSVQSSIDGLRTIAERSGEYDGQDEPEYEYEKDNSLKLARVRVYRKGISRPFVGVARWSEYVQTTKEGAVTKFWRQMAHTMLAKCAEALAIRKAFPSDTGRLYVPEEMAQAVIEQTESDRELEQVSDWGDRINECETLEALNLLGQEIKTVKDLPKQALGVIRAAYKRKQEELNAVAVKALPAPQANATPKAEQPSPAAKTEPAPVPSEPVPVMSSPAPAANGAPPVDPAAPIDRATIEGILATSAALKLTWPKCRNEFATSCGFKPDIGGISELNQFQGHMLLTVLKGVEATKKRKKSDDTKETEAAKA